MTMNRHEPFEELISASLQGDLTEDERRRLDAHLDGCDQCRQTLAAFSDQRRIVAGLRHVAPPRDLGARVRAGVESASIPWWRKPTTIFTAVGGTLAAVTGALLALVVLNGTTTSRRRPGVANPDRGRHPGRVRVAPARGHRSTRHDAARPDRSRARPRRDAEPSATPNPVSSPSPEPDLYVAMTLVGRRSVFDRRRSRPAKRHRRAEPRPRPDRRSPPSFRPTADGSRWSTENGLSGTDQVQVSRVAEALPPPDETGATPIPEPDLGSPRRFRSASPSPGSPFLERLAWAPDGSALALHARRSGRRRHRRVDLRPRLGRALAADRHRRLLRRQLGHATGDRSRDASGAVGQPRKRTGHQLPPVSDDRPTGSARSSSIRPT